jgi:predicted phosphodiesterase
MPMRVVVLSDIHSNLVALDAVLAAAGPVDRVWHLGDVVGYGPDPDGVVARLAALDAIGVRGNHDAAAVGGSEIEWFNPDARRAIEWTRDRMSPSTRRWLAALPETRLESGFALVHGSLRDPTWEYVLSTAVARASLDILVEGGLHRALFGHTHLPTVFRDDGGNVEAARATIGATLDLDERPAMLNPGSVGQPRDGRPEASYLVLDLDADVVTWGRVAYDIATVQAAIRAAGLPERLAARLELGA